MAQAGAKIVRKSQTRHMRVLLAGLILLLAVTTTFAQPAAPPLEGWAKTTQNAGYRYTTATNKGDIQYDLLFPHKEPMEGSPVDFLVKLAENDMGSAGYTQNPAKRAQRQTERNFYSYSVFVKDGRGGQRALCYLAYIGADQEFYFARILMPDDPVAIPGLKTALNHFINYARPGGTGPGNRGGAPAPGPGAGGATAPKVNFPTGKNNNNVETPVTAPGQGLKPSEIKGIVLHSEYTMGVGGMMIIVYRPYLLLTDGRLYAHPDVPPYDLDVARSLQVERSKWGTWKLEGKTMTVQYGYDRNGNPDKASTWTSFTWARGAKPGEKMVGSWGTISGGGNTAFGGGSIVVSTNNFTFNNQGQFTTLSAGGGSYSGPTGRVSAYSNRDGAGTYTLDGFSVEFKYNNGKVVRRCLYFYSDDQEVFGIGTRAYTPADNKKH